MKLSAPNRSVQEWQELIGILVPEEDLRLSERIAQLIFGASFSQVIHGYYRERCEFLNSSERKLEGPFYEACDRFLFQHQENDILELSRRDVFDKFQIFNNALHDVIIRAGVQMSLTEMRTLETEIESNRKHFMELANGDVDHVDETIEAVIDMLHLECVYDDGSEVLMGNEQRFDGQNENDNHSVEIEFDIDSKPVVLQKPHFIFPGAVGKRFFSSFSKGLEKHGFISSADLFFYRFFPLLDDDVDLTKPLIWAGDAESLLFVFRLFIEKSLISDLRESKAGKSLNQLISEAFVDPIGHPLKANSLSKTASRTKMNHDSWDKILQNLNEQTGTIYDIFKACFE